MKSKIKLEKPKIYSKEFSLSETLECGQFFRYYKIEDKKYNILAGNKLIEIEDNEEYLECCIYTEDEAVEEKNVYMLNNLFDFNTNYEEIKEVLSQNDEVMQEAIKLCGGIHLMNQEPFETLLSFIISQNNNIPRIKSIIGRLSKSFGEEINYNKDGEEFFGFPSCEKLIDVSIDDFSEKCGTGFRSKYLADAIKSVNDGKIIVNAEETKDMTTDSIREMLMTIYGVGRKVSDCCLLFAYKRKEVYPIDVWIKRITQELYFDAQEISNDELQKFALEKFGEYAGFAQQYLFHYARNKMQ